MRRWTFCIGGMRMRWIEGEFSGWEVVASRKDFGLLVFS
jgi:hypothetical protein